MWTGRLVRLAAKRFLRDLGRTLGKRPPFHFSSLWATKHCRFIECCPHVEGKWATPTLRLQPAQIFFVVNLFGFRAKEGGRRFSEALLCIARKNAKSTLAAAILLSCECLEDENGAQVISAATTGGQARIVWKIAKEMVDRTPDMGAIFGLETSAKLIRRAEIGAEFKPINSKASTQDGLNPSHCGLDEIHAHKTHDLLNVLRSAAGARANPLWLYTTTEGYETPGPWPEIRAFAIAVLKGLFRADHFLAVIFALDESDGPEADFDESKWIKANPLYPVNPSMRREMRKLAVNARAMPGTHAEFRIKRLNRPAASAQSWVNLSKWNGCATHVPVAELAGKPCWGAFDGASTGDMASFCLLWHDLEARRFYCALRYWVPEESVRQRTERRSVPYAGWVKQGYVQQTSGDVIDYELIEANILEDYERFQPRAIGFDPWNSTNLSSRLIDQGLPCQTFIQGPRSYNPAMKACEIAYTSGSLSHGGNPVLTWNMANVVPRTDVNLNLAPDKKRSAEKIDGACALFMCFGLCDVDQEEGFNRYLQNVVSM